MQWKLKKTILTNVASLIYLVILRIYSTSYQERFDTKSFYSREIGTVDWGSYMAITKNVWSSQHSPLGVPQAINSALLSRYCQRVRPPVIRWSTQYHLHGVTAKWTLDVSKVGDQKAPFSIATTPMCRLGHYSFPKIAPLYPWYIPYIAEC